MITWISSSIGTAPCRDITESDFKVVFVNDLLEGSGNDSAVLAERILACLKILKQNCKLVICCDRGIVRSNTFAAAILVKSGFTYRKAVRSVTDKLGSDALNLDLFYDLVR